MGKQRPLPGPGPTHQNSLALLLRSSGKQPVLRRKGSCSFLINSQSSHPSTRLDSGFLRAGKAKLERRWGDGGGGRGPKRPPVTLSSTGYLCQSYPTVLSAERNTHLITCQQTADLVEQALQLPG